jgi:pilus assembly protein CpaB
MRSTLIAKTRRYASILAAGGAGMMALLLFVALPAEAPRAAARSQPAPQGVAVLVGRRPIAAGTRIAASDVTLKRAAAAAPGLITAPELAVGRISRRAIAAGEMLRNSDLQQPGAIGLAARLRPGERAFSIRVTEDDIVGGFLQSGNRVDIFATLPGSVFPRKDAAQTADRSHAVLLLQNITVLAVGDNPATRGAVQTGARTVSLSLTPTQLARLSLALRFGKVSLAARAPGDDAVSDVVGATLADLLPASPPPPPPHAAARPRPAGVPMLLGTRAVRAVPERQS